MTSNYIKNAPRVCTNALLANFGEAMLMCWCKHTVAIGPTFSTTQSKTDLAQSKVGFKYLYVAFVKLRFVARNGIQMLLTELANANVAIRFVGVVVGQSDVGRTTLEAQLCCKFGPASQKYRLCCRLTSFQVVGVTLAWHSVVGAKYHLWLNLQDVWHKHLGKPVGCVVATIMEGQKDYVRNAQKFGGS